MTPDRDAPPSRHAPAAAAPFVGRARELQTLGELAADARAGQARLVLVEGESGVGKSTLLHHFIDHLGPVTLLHAVGNEAEMLLPFGIVDQLVRQAGPLAATDLARLASAVGADLDPLSVGAELVGLLGALQDDGALVVVMVDDLQWVDTASATALLFAFRRLGHDRVLGLVSARRGALGRLGQGWASMIGGDPRSAGLHLGGLTEDELDQLGTQMGVAPLSAAALTRLVQHTGGSPLHCRALLEELSAETLGRMETDLPAPRALASIVLLRVAALSAVAARFVTAAAVLGLESPIALVGSVAGLDNPVGALDEAALAGIMTPILGPGPGTVAFVHSLMQRAIYDDLSPSTRSALHLEAARHLEGTANLSHRSRAASTTDESLAADLEAAALDAQAAFASAQAVAWLTRAAEVSPESEARHRRLLDALELAINTGDTTTANALAARLTEFDAQPRTLALLGHLAMISGQFAEAERQLVRAWEASSPETKMTSGAQAAASMAMYCLLVGRGAEAVAWSERAWSAGGQDSRLRLHILNFLVLNLAIAGRGAEALGHLAAFPEASGEMPADQSSVLVFRGMARLFTDDLVGARRDLATAAARHRAGATFNFDTHGLTMLVDAEFRAGAWDEASVHADFAVSVAHDADRVWDFGFVHAHAALVPAGRGDWATATAHLDEAWGWADGFGVGLAMAMVTTGRALMAWGQADWLSVLGAADALRSFGHLETLGRPGVHNWRALEVEALLELERVDQAGRALDELEVAIGPSRLPSGLLDAARLRGMLAERQGDRAGADAAFSTARHLAAGVSMPLPVALFEMSDGDRLLQRGEPHKAIASLAAAEQLLRALRAQPVLDRCQALLVAAGAVPEATQVAPVGGLTPTELVVARLVAGGSTNREVAGELYVSVKAIEFHLSNIFAKLGIRSRRDIAAHLGPAPPP